jgi:hypothetical protein
MVLSGIRAIYVSKMIRDARAICRPGLQGRSHSLRDIEDLVKRGILVKDAAGRRSTSYSLVGIE